MTRIKVENLSKNFNIDFRRDEGILAKLIKFLYGERERHQRIALENISFRVSSGEVFALIGKNGSGKSTLLKTIAGIYKPTQGFVKTNGELVYLTSLGLWLLPKLTMRENIYLAGSIMDLEQREIKQKFNQIVEFSGLKEHIDTKIYQFSTGMTARLSFSVTFFCIQHKNPDILLIDEVFGAGGDIDFEKKAEKKMEELIRGGAAVIMASHDLELVKKYCNKVIWLDGGRVIRIGNPSEVVENYIKSV